MKIGLVCPYNIYKGGGVQEHVRATSAELIQRGHTVKIITPQPKEALSESSKDIIFIGRSRDIKSPLHTTSQISVSLNGDVVEEVLAREKFDILHFHEPWVPVVSRQILSRSASKNVATFHAKLPDTMMSKTIERVITPYTKSIMKYLDGLTAVSKAAAMYVETLTDKQITIIPNGINLDKYKARKDARQKYTGTKTVLYVGRLERRKGVKYLLKAFALLSSKLSNIQLVIAGDGPDRKKLQLYTENLRLSNVEFLGFVSEKEKSKLFQTADLFCSPALFGESFGIVLLEAMAVGLPLVAGDNPGYSGVMTDRGQLSLVDPHNTDEFARRLEIMLMDEELRKLWREWAEAQVKQFSYPNVVDKYEVLYKSIL